MKMKFVIITSARNEGKFIEQTIKSVIAQTILPEKWIIVSDGSMDDTDEIVKKHLKKYKWIELLRMPEHKERHFAAKANCINAGINKISALKFDYIIILDADISFESDYFEFILKKIKKAPKLGIAGTSFNEGTFNSYKDTSKDTKFVSGQCQVFRKECYESIGGYKPIKEGGIDWVACKTARMKGWDTKTFIEKNFIHHRKMGTAVNNIFVARFKQGCEDYYLANHPLWELFRISFQIFKKPYFLGGFLIFCGYFISFLKRTKHPISKELITFHRNEQLQTLREYFMNCLNKIKKNFLHKSKMIL